ncbi:Protein sel-1 [Paramyrothecium foliicola]|nr:Protein sel-1 [Paramyrothecium foliicola]
MRTSAVWLLLLLQATIGATTNAQHYFDKERDRAAKQLKQDEAASNVKTDVVVDHGKPTVPQPGAELVDAAFVEISKIPRSSYIRRHKRSGIIGTLIDYAWLAIPMGPAYAPSSDKTGSVTGHLASAVDLLQQAARQNNSDAIYVLADFNFFGNYSHPRNLNVAFDHYQQLALDFGNTTAQYMLGVYFSNGLGDVVPRDQAKALLYYTFAAIRGDTRAEMATAFRHHAGIGTPKNCDAAVRYYKRVADKAIQWYRSGPPGGRTWIYQSWRIPDDDGGIYGEGASASSAGLNAFRMGPASDANAAIGDVIEYLDLMSQKGDSKASLNLGRIYHDGQRGLDKDFDLAKKYFFLVASRYWRRDGRLVENHKPGIEKTASKAAGYIGRMYLRGDGVAQNFDKARMWFERGISHGDAQSQYGLGLMLLNGYGGKENIRKAMELIRVSSEQGYSHAQVQMGRLYLDQGGPEDVRIANNHFELAAQHGNMEAYYHLGEMIHYGVGRERLCGQALNYYKAVAEKAEPLLSSWADATSAFDTGDLDTAFLHYLLAAEQGYEKAQTNVAHLLDPARSKLPLSSVLKTEKPRSPLLDNPALALIYWTRSSRQSNVDSLVKVGDYYFYGIGTEVDVSKAVQCYAGASDYSQSAQALFNMGWMHENGIGLTQDFHLAKRHYDQALEINEEAYLPVTLSLLKLRLRSAWNSFTHGPIHSIQDEPQQGKDWSLSEWITNFFQDEGYVYDDNGEYYDDDVYGGHEEDEFDDAGVVESLLIIGITVSLVFLLWWRQRMQQAHAQAEDARRQDQGLPPRQGQENRGDAGDAFPAWAAGGIGL